MIFLIIIDYNISNNCEDFIRSCSISVEEESPSVLHRSYTTGDLNDVYVSLRSSSGAVIPSLGEKGRTPPYTDYTFLRRYVNTRKKKAPHLLPNDRPRCIVSYSAAICLRDPGLRYHDDTRWHLFRDLLGSAREPPFPVRGNPSSTILSSREPRVLAYGWTRVK